MPAIAFNIYILTCKCIQFVLTSQVAYTIFIYQNTQAYTGVVPCTYGNDNSFSICAMKMNKLIIQYDKLLCSRRFLLYYYYIDVLQHDNETTMCIICVTSCGEVRAQTIWINCTWPQIFTSLCIIWTWHRITIDFSVSLKWTRMCGGACSLNTWLVLKMYSESFLFSNFGKNRIWY